MTTFTIWKKNYAVLKSFLQSLSLTNQRLKKKKTKNLMIHETYVLKVENKPIDAKFKGYRPFAIQDISI